MVFLERIKKSVFENKLIFAALGVLIACNMIISFTSKKSADVVAPIQADTIIPAGHVLLPITLMNIESIKGLITQFGVIDLYVSSSPNSPGKKRPSTTSSFIKNY